MTKDKIREIFMKHGFTVKEGQTDLKDYVYKAAEELLEKQRCAMRTKGLDSEEFLPEVSGNLGHSQDLTKVIQEAITDLKAIEPSFDGRIGELFTKIDLVVMNLEEIENG